MLNHFKWKLFRLHTVFSWRYLKNTVAKLWFSAEVVTSRWRLSKSCAVSADSKLGGGIPGWFDNLLWIWEIRWFGVFTILVLRVPFLIFFKKGACVFCKDNAVFVSKHIVQQKFNKIEQATQIIENFLPKKKRFTLIQRGKRFQKQLGHHQKRFQKAPGTPTQQLDVRSMIICACSLPCAFMLRGGILRCGDSGMDAGGMDGSSYLMIWRSHKRYILWKRAMSFLKFPL